LARYPLLGLPEFATVAALDHYIIRKHRALGDLSEHLAKTRNIFPNSLLSSKSLMV
jgi:glutaredoxin 2